MSWSGGGGVAEGDRGGQKNLSSDCFHKETNSTDSRFDVQMFFFSELAKQVRAIFVNCVGEVDPDISTMELLKRIELRMESLTQDLERLPPEKVKIAQRVSF